MANTENKFGFTKERLDNATCPPGQDRAYFYDTKVPGLAFCVTAAGRKTFYVYRWLSTTGQPCRVRLGRYPNLTIENVRKMTAQAVAKISKGEDPADDRRQARGERTFGELFDLFLENHSKPNKRTWREDEAQYKRYLEGWKNRKLSSIDRSDAKALHATVGRDNGHYAANRMLALLVTMFNYAAELGHKGQNPAMKIKRFKEQSRARFLRPDEMESFSAAVGDGRTPPLWRDLIVVALLTGARRANVFGMKWENLELTRGLWTVPGEVSKNGDPMTIILHPQAVEILHRRVADNEALPPEQRSPFVFPGRGKSGHVTDAAKPWRDVVQRAGVADLHFHDLRRTLGSWMAALGTSLPIIGKTLGHRNLATTQIYSRLDLEPVRVSVTAAGDAMLKAANGGAIEAQKNLPAPKDSEQDKAGEQ